MPIYFYSTREVPYGCFSNFSAHGFELDGLYWRSSEHYFQAQKFAGHPEPIEAIRLMPSPKQAASAGRSRQRPLRPDWERVKDDIMRKAVLRKFQTHPDIRAVLLDTGPEEPIEKTPSDHYWGCITDGSGQNMLGQILMETRALLRGEK